MKGKTKMDRIEITYGQKILMSLYNEPDFCVNLSFAFKIKGKIDKAKLEESLQKTIDDNNAFRFKFHKDEETGKIYQYTVEKVEYKLDEREADGNTYEEKYKNVKKQTQKILSEIKCLSDELMWDFILFNMGNEHIFYVRINHLICDGVAIVATLVNIISNYNGIPLKKSLGLEEFMKEQREFEKTENYFNMFKKLEKQIEDYKSYKSFIKLPEKNRKKTSSRNVAAVESEKLSEFCKKNKLSFFHASLFFYHVAISAVYGKKDTQIIVPIGTRKSSYRNTIGYLVSACFSRLILEDDTSLKEAVMECRDDFFENSKTAPIFFKMFCDNNFSHEFLLTYQNQVTSFDKHIPFGEAEVENIIDQELVGIPQPVEMNVASLSAIETGNNIVFSIRADEDVFSDDMRKKAGKAFILAAKCLAEEDMTFKSFCDTLDKM